MCTCARRGVNDKGNRVGNQKLGSLVPLTLSATLNKCVGAQTPTRSDGSCTQTSSVSSAHGQLTALILPFLDANACTGTRRQCAGFALTQRFSLASQTCLKRQTDSSEHGKQPVGSLIQTETEHQHHTLLMILMAQTRVIQTSTFVLNRFNLAFFGKGVAQNTCKTLAKGVGTDYYPTFEGSGFDSRPGPN